MLKGAPMIKEEGIYGFEPSFIKGNSKLLNLYSKVLNTYIGIIILCIALESPACTERDIEEYNDCSNERNNNRNLPIPVC
jgi:hypothetical protein